MYGEFDLTIPETLQEAVKVLAAAGKRAVPLAGGTNVLVDVRSQRLAPHRIVDLGRIGGLRGISVEGGRVTLGPRTTISELLASDEIARTAPALGDAARVFAGQMVRNAATVAGNIACGSPAADLVPPLLALDAEVTLTGARGSRTVALCDYYTGYKADQRAPDELITAISWPVPVKGTFGSFYKLARRKGDAITVVGVAVGLGRKEGCCAGVRIALGSVAPCPIRARKAEGVLEGEAPTAERIAEAARIAAEECSPIDDVRATGEYRRKMVEVLVARLVNSAVQAGK
ncbi:FAD binding domain-containing protein [Defluviimonas sp. SAOS-178_SWC]|uniref:FAD binding domain-containing protein n=1 Tax=Defluviimonas sp. SAOS-178_SWC TaxID=3121287 RepID=UPI003221C0C6